jgi:hypothetical protein
VSCLSFAGSFSTSTASSTSAGDLLVSSAPPTAPTRFTDWLGRHAEELGRTWANELARHFRCPI